jgi:chromosome segregation ATPase
VGRIKMNEKKREELSSKEEMRRLDEKVTAFSLSLKENDNKMQELEEEIVRVKGGLEQRIGEFEKEVSGIADKMESVDEKVTALSDSLQKNSSESKQLSEKLSCRLKDVEEKLGGRLEKVENRAPEVSKEDMGNVEEKISELYNNLDRLARDIRGYLGIADIKDMIGQIVKKK